MEGFEVLVAMVTVLAAVMLFFSLAAYRREGSPQLRFVLVISGLFFVKGIALTAWILVDISEDTSDVFAISLLMDFVILLFLFVAGFAGAKKKEESTTEDTKEKARDDEHTGV